jgi:hypothetical protein
MCDSVGFIDCVIVSSLLLLFLKQSNFLEAGQGQTCESEA